MERKKIVVSTAIIGVLIAAFLVPGQVRLKTLQEDNERYKQRIKMLKEHNQDLEKELLEVTEDPDYVEKKARDKLGIIRKGEVIYRTKDKLE
ncbi:MAG: septum formation initiator family protein [Candidatus Aadella gelida]|nr:septum formation initiator family protein [Candidatus Aadella gelida]